MRTAVVRVRVDREGKLDAVQLDRGLERLRELAYAAEAEVVENDLAGMPVGRREVQLLIDGSDRTEPERAAITMCADAFRHRAGCRCRHLRQPRDRRRRARRTGGFGLTGAIDRTPGADGFDVVTVTLRVPSANSFIGILPVSP